MGAGAAILLRHNDNADHLSLIVSPQSEQGGCRAIPWRIVHESDATARPVSAAASAFLDSIDDLPLVSLTSLSTEVLRKSPRLSRMHRALARIVAGMAAVIASAEEQAEERAEKEAQEEEEGGPGEEALAAKNLATASSPALKTPLKRANTLAAFFSRTPPSEDAGGASARAAYAAAGGGALRSAASSGAPLSPQAQEGAADPADGALAGAEGVLVECIAIVREALGDCMQFNFRRSPQPAAQLLVPLRVLADAAAVGAPRRPAAAGGAANDAVGRIVAALAALNAFARSRESGAKE